MDMQFKVQKVIFFKDNDSKTDKKTTVVMPIKAHTALLEVAKVTGKKVPEVIQGALELFLIEMIRQKIVNIPKGEEQTYQDIISSETPVSQPANSSHNRSSKG